MDRCEVQIPRGDCTNRPLTQRRRAGFSGVYPFRSKPVPRSARGRYGRFDRSSMRAHSFRSVFGTTFLRRQTLFRQASGSSLQHMRCRRQRLSVQDRNDPNRSACARQTHRMRWRNGIASHSSSVRRPGKLRLPMCIVECSHFGHSNVRRSNPGWSGSIRASSIVMPHLGHGGRIIASDAEVAGWKRVIAFPPSRREPNCLSAINSPGAGPLPMMTELCA